MRADVVDAVTEVNELARRFADLNGEIRKAGTSGGSINELLDEQNRLANELSQRIGSTLRRGADGTAEVIVGGNALVSGTTARPLQVAGALDAEGVASGPVRVEWVHRPGSSAEIDNGEIGGRLAALASAADGGPLLTQLGALDDIATSLATKVNALHQTGATRAGATGLNFFQLASGERPSQGLSLVSTDVNHIAAATPLTGVRAARWPTRSPFSRARATGRTRSGTSTSSRSAPHPAPPRRARRSPSRRVRARSRRCSPRPGSTSTRRPWRS